MILLFRTGKRGIKIGLSAIFKTCAGTYQTAWVFVFIMDSDDIIYKDVSPEILQKAAKIIDSKAYINFYKLGKRYCVRVNIRDDFPEDRDFLFQHFGGYKYDQIKDDKTFYWLNFQQIRAFKLIDKIFPYMEEQREILTEIVFLKKMIEKNRFRRLSEETLEARRVLFEKIKALNKARFAHLKNSTNSTSDF